jgi:hypothetical protein
MGEMRDAYVLVRKPEGKRPLGRPRHRWEYNIRMSSSSPSRYRPAACSVSEVKFLNL